MLMLTEAQSSRCIIEKSFSSFNVGDSCHVAMFLGREGLVVALSSGYSDFELKRVMPNFVFSYTLSLV